MLLHCFGKGDLSCTTGSQNVEFWQHVRGASVSYDKFLASAAQP